MPFTNSDQTAQAQEMLKAIEQAVLQGDHLWWGGFILWLPLISLILCGVCWFLRVKSKLPALITVVCLGLSFAVTVALAICYNSDGEWVTIRLFEWFDLSWGDGESFIANFTLYVDSLTLLWMLFVTGIGTLIAIYASEYMEHDKGRGYSRFFAGISVFLFAMGALVMGDNLLMLYLGWEGVGFASYWLIGYFYQRPAAVAAAKKAFIVNRIGDLGLAIAIYLIWQNFGTVEYTVLWEHIATGQYLTESAGWSASVIPWLLMLAAFGKSAQLPLYVWLPDAMEGPTPVSALIHAATMVTAGIYLLARTYPLFTLGWVPGDPYPLTLSVVAWVGGLTALFAATIAMAQHDIKRIMAYSTVSQLGYMFLGLGVLTSYGAAFHVFTHAFFKAALFLTCGAIMHGFAGQLDLRKLSGLIHIKGWRITALAMLVGCLCLAGFPFTSGYISKDAILAEAFVTSGHGFETLGWIALVTALLTAYYTFRVWFRVCAGPVSYEPGDELHDNGCDASHFHPHAPRIAINSVLVVIAIGALVAVVPYAWGKFFGSNWVAAAVVDSSASEGVPQMLWNQADQSLYQAESHAIDEHPTLLGGDPHVVMYVLSGGIAILGIAIAFYFHLWRRQSADRLRSILRGNPITGWLPRCMEHKWYVDEFYDFVIRTPLWILGRICALFDRYIIDIAIVNGVASIPRLCGRVLQGLHNGVLQSYAVTMAGGAGLIIVVVIYLPDLVEVFQNWMGGTGS